LWRGIIYTKVITKIDKQNARAWCGSKKPPKRIKPLRSKRPLLVGYLALKSLLGSQNYGTSSNMFRCNIGCYGAGAVIGSESPTKPLNCKCGETVGRRSSKAYRRSGSSSSLSRAASIQSLLGLSSSSLTRIVGGSAAAEGSVPWQASLAVSGSNIFCGASIVTDRHLVTAAHCVAGVEQSVLGMVDILINEYDTTDDKSPVRRKVRKVVIHPGFDENTLRNDIAVVTLKRSIRLVGGPISSVCLPTTTFNTPVNSVATVTGFGTTSADTDQPSTRLLTVDVNIISNSDCKFKNNVYSSKVVDTMLCASVPQGGKDACKRDSGGPLVSSEGGKNTLVGVVSWGQGCAEARYPGVYTRVSKYRDWIDKMVVSGRKCRG